MARRNRVSPFGNIEADPARGTLMGNRGCLVNASGELVRDWNGKRWITCLLEFKGRPPRRPLMAPGRYTELFFLDEATACAAGHRPCFECRRADANAFAAAWHPGWARDRADAAVDRRRDARRLAAYGLAGAAVGGRSRMTHSAATTGSAAAPIATDAMPIASRATPPATTSAAPDIAPSRSASPMTVARSPGAT
jgi:hypothetical protein